jgi:hypothetical protein
VAGHVREAHARHEFRLARARRGNDFYSLGHCSFGCGSLVVVVLARASRNCLCRRLGVLPPPQGGGLGRGLRAKVTPIRLPSRRFAALRQSTSPFQGEVTRGTSSDEVWLSVCGFPPDVCSRYAIFAARASWMACQTR